MKIIIGSYNEIQVTNKWYIPAQVRAVLNSLQKSTCKRWKNRPLIRPKVSLPYVPFSFLSVMCCSRWR